MLKNRLSTWASIPILACAILFIVHHELGYSQNIDWQLTSNISKKIFEPLQFTKGFFNLSLTGNIYFVEQSFSGGEISSSKPWLIFYLTLIAIGLSGILAVTSFWRRYAFIAVCALFILFFNFLNLDNLGLLGIEAGKKWVTAILLISILGPAYILHAFFEKSGILARWAILLIIFLGIFTLFLFNSPGLSLYLLSNATNGLALITLLFIFLISEEIIFLILYLITRGKSGTGNEKHFLIFGFAYLIYLGLYYSKKAGFIDTDSIFLNPFYLLFISTIISSWSIGKKQEIYNTVLQKDISIYWFWLFLGIVAFSYLNLNFQRGNDAAYEGMHYMIIYAHLGFGFMFFCYVLVNFINPLSKGFTIYKIVYKEQNFPYSTARLGGLAAVAAFYFLADQEAFDLTTAARYNYMGDYYKSQNEQMLADQYYLESSRYGWDNHYGNYSLAKSAENKNDPSEASYRYFRASRRFPSEYAYINTAESFKKLEEQSRILPILQEGEVDFPKSGEICNNLALALIKNKAFNEALNKLNKNKTSGKWNKATQVNKWQVNLDSAVQPEFEKFPPELNANILAKNIESDRRLEPSLTVQSFPDIINLHSIAFLINANWMWNGFDTDTLTQKFAAGTLDENVKVDLNHSYAISQFLAGNHNMSLEVFDILQNSPYSFYKSYFLNQTGLLFLALNEPQLAYEYFSKAIERKNERAKINKLISMMEIGLWDEIEEYLIQNPELKSKIPEGVLAFINGSEENIELATYYKWRNFSTEKLVENLNLCSGSIQLQSLNKILNEYSRRDEMVYVPEPIKEYISSNENLTKILSSYFVDDPYTITTEEVQKSAFNEILIYKWLERDDIEDNVKYEILNKATNLNSYSPGLIKKYCFAAIDIGVPEYATSSLLSLKTLISQEEYDKFVNQFEQRKREKEEEVWNF